MDVQDKIQEFFDLNNRKVVIIDNNCVLTEIDKKTNKLIMECGVSIDGYCILFNNVDDNKCKFFSSLKASDYVIMQEKDGLWILHIIELKTTVNPNEWAHIKKQFMGSYLHAIAYSKILDINFVEYKFYTFYLNDEIAEITKANIAKLKGRINNRKLYPDWNKGFYQLKCIDGLDNTFKHITMPLETNSDGIAVGSITL